MNDSLDFNADVGEGDNDAGILPWVSSASIACGFHAGGPETMRETVALCREALGGNGIVLDYDVARFHADAEALYSYEGTREMNSLIVGRAITGVGAFV